MGSWTRMALLAAAMALVACGGGGDETPTTTATTAPPTAQTPPSTVAGTQEQEGEPISIFLDADKIEGKAPLTVHFDVDVDGGTPPFKWSWDYGDGNTGDAADPKHAYTYDKPGTYMVELEVEDATGDSDFDILEIEVFEE
jgi:PKD repeat protein